MKSILWLDNLIQSLFYVFKEYCIYNNEYDCMITKNDDCFEYSNGSNSIHVNCSNHLCHF